MKHETKFAQWIRFGGRSEFLVPLTHQVVIERKFSTVPDRLLESVLDDALVTAVTELNNSLPENTSINISSVDLSDIKSEFADVVAARIGQIGLPLNPNDPVISAAIKHYAAQINARLQQDGLGVTRYVWRSQDDASVRATHRSYDDQQFSWDNPPEGGNPGDAYGCRCTAEPVVEGVVFPDGAVCDIVNPEMLLEVFPKAPLDRLIEIAREIDLQIVSGKLDSPERRAHFFGQVLQEAGPRARLNESLDYLPENLGPKFSYFRRNPKEAELYGRTPDHAADQEAIANRGYANRIGNGDVASGDGWKFRGRGLVQLTGRANYRDFTQWHNEFFDDIVDFEEEPDTLIQPKFGVRSALYFWVANELYLLADEGVSQSVSNRITDVINGGTDSKLDRWEHVKGIHDAKIFQTVCNFSTSKPRFEDQ